MLGQCFQTLPSAASPLDKETPFGNLRAVAVDVRLTQSCYKVPQLQIKSSVILKFSEQQPPSTNYLCSDIFIMQKQPQAQGRTGSHHTRCCTDRLERQPIPQRAPSLKLFQF